MSGATALDFTMGMVRHAEDAEPTEVSFRAVIAGIREGRWRGQVEKVRAAWESGDKKATALLKKQLPAGLFSGTFPYRSADKLKDHTGTICVDLDQLENVEGTRDLIVADPHTLACFVSPTGTGLKVIFKVEPAPARPHHESYLAAEAYVRGRFGLEIDTACKDVSRLCFVSYDPDAFLADDAEVLPYPKATEEVDAPATVTSHIRRNFPIGLISPGDDYNARGDRVALLKKHRWTEAHEPYWTRPDKKDGVSASWDVVPGCFHVFTSSAPPLRPANYKPFALFAILECDGDFQKASDALYDLGYGTRRKPKAILPEPDQQAHIDAENEASAIASNHGSNGETSEEQMERLTAAHNRRVMAESPLAPAGPAKAPEDQAKKNADLLARCYAAEFNFAIVPPRPIPRFLIKGHQACTGGNLTTITGQAKTAKTGVVDAMIASVIAAHNGNAKDCDCLGFTASGPNEKHLAHLDCEQAVFDHDQVMRRSHRRSHAEIWPAFIHSFCLTGFSIHERRALIPLILEDMEKRGGVHSLFIDGAADLLPGVNSEEDSNVLVADLQNLAMRYNCPIISVIHENPGQDGGKMRGHLGSQLERKAESNIRLVKSGEVITLFSQKMRHGLIMEKDGPTFKWDFDASMHLSCQKGISPKDQAKRDKLTDLLEATLAHAGKERLRYADFLKAIAEVAGVGPSRAEVRYSEMRAVGLIAKDLLGFWGRK